MIRVCRLLFLILFCLLLSAARAQVDWSWRTPPVINKVIYADGQFTAVGNYGHVLVSHNGQSWTAQTPGTQRSLRDVTFQPGKWVAVGENGRVVASADGRIWTEYATPSTAILVSATSANGLFVVGDFNGAILTSTDGMNWVIRYTPSLDANIVGTAYGNGRFVTLPAYNSKIHYSSDGITWTSATAKGFLSDMAGLAFGNGLFVAVGSAGHVYTSLDGVNWTGQTSGVTTNFTGVAFGGGQFIAGSTSGTVLTSPNGITWTQHATGGTNAIGTMGFGNGTWVAFDQAQQTSPRFSRDLNMWTMSARPVTTGLTAAAYGNGTYIVVGQSGIILSSTDGFHWTARNSGVTRDLQAAIYGGGLFVVTGGYGEILTSPDGINWTRHPTSITGIATPVLAVAYGNNRYVALYGTSLSGGVVTSTDGTNWVVVNLSSSVSFPAYTLASNGTSFLLIAHWCEAWSSTNGTTWTKVRSGVTGDVGSGVAYGNGVYAISGYAGKLWTTTDGATWALQTSHSTGDFYAMGFANGNFVATGRFGLVETSTDGVTWTTRASGCENDETLWTAGASPNLFVIPADSGEIVTSWVRVGYPYSAWRQDYFTDDEFALPVSDIDSTPAGDNLPNKIKYALGVPPRDNAVAMGVAPSLGTVADTAGLHGAMTLPESRNAGGLLQYRLLGSQSLSPASWSDTGASVTLMSMGTNNNVVQLVDPVVTGSKFFRLEIDFGSQLGQ